MVNPVPCHIKLMNFPFAGNSFVYAFNVKTCFTKMTATGIVFFFASFLLSIWCGSSGGSDDDDSGGGGVSTHAMLANKLNNLKSVANI